MAITVPHSSGSASSGAIPRMNAERFDEVDRRHRMLANFLESKDLDGILLQTPANFAWLTAGADCRQCSTSTTTAALFVTPEARVVIGRSEEMSQLFERELPILGFQMKERAWYESRRILLNDLCRGRRVGSDTGVLQTDDVSFELAQFRNPLTLRACEQIRQLGRDVAHAVEATARALRGGRTEADVAGELSHRLVKRQITPTEIQILADDRHAQYPHWTYGGDVIQQRCTLRATGMRAGVHASASRTVALQTPSNAFLEAFQKASMLLATSLFFSQAGWAINEVMDRVRRMYEKLGYGDGWRIHDQGGVIGYSACDIPFAPQSPYRIRPQTALSWHPSVGPAIAGETILVAADGFELLSTREQWPTIEVAVKGSPVSVPGIWLGAD